MELQFFEKRRESGGREIVGDDFGAGREAGLDPRFYLQAALHRFFSEETSAEHQRRIRGVSATGDGGDDHCAAGKIEGVAIAANLDVFLRGAFDRSEEHTSELQSLAY